MTEDTVQIALDEKQTQYPRKWKNKTNGQIMRAIPWYEMLEPDTMLHGKLIEKAKPFKRKFKIGALVQCGWLVSNVHDCYFGVGFIEDQFEDLGEWTEGDYEEKRNAEQRPAE